MSDHVISIIGLVLVFAVATVFSVHMGVLALVAAFVVGTAFASQSTDQIFAGFPGDLFVVLVGVTFLFAIAGNNGTVDWLVHRCIQATGGRAALMPWVMFLVTALLAGVGAVTPAAVGIIAPIGMSVARRYGMSPLLMGVFIINGGSAGGFSPIGVYGTITNGVVSRNDLPGSPGTLFLLSLLFNILLNIAAFFVFGGRGLLRRRGTDTPGAAGAADARDTADAPATADVTGTADATAPPRGGSGASQSSTGRPGTGRPVTGPNRTRPPTGEPAPSTPASAPPQPASPASTLSVTGGTGDTGDTGDAGKTDSVPTDRRQQPIGLDLPRTLTLLGLLGVVVGALFFDLDVGLMALSVAVVLSLASPESAKGAADKCAWTTVLLVCGIVTYVNLMDRIGTIDFLGEKVTSIEAPLLAALLICLIGALVTAFASTTGILGALIPLAVPFLLSGEVGAVALVAALAISSSVVDASPFSTSGALVTANATDDERDTVFRRLMIWGFSLVLIVPATTWALLVVPGW
ncbi:SLC13 family permease [Streptomyces iconiensis]|uniref:SLC13 family permease n=1 Tax=Streptomyces iconiensis TaxID=1384038 RepID=A0ABT6ZN32_9ACTN|nr:SLC13 family permease [Streptomyces iconiensis]MDJ1130474.1 SLC13 family permease [Streptomyces iconiensis]